MEASVLQELKERLLYLKHEIMSRIKENTDKVNKIMIRGDEGDFSDAVYTKDILYDLLEKDRQHLREIEESLYSIEKGDYGRCRMCGKDIEIERMKAKPTAKYCIKCRAVVEGKR